MASFGQPGTAQIVLTGTMISPELARVLARARPKTPNPPCLRGILSEYRYRDSNPGFRRERVMKHSRGLPEIPDLQNQPETGGIPRHA